MQARRLLTRLPTSVRRMSSDCRSSNSRTTNSRSTNTQTTDEGGPGDFLGGLWLLGIVPYWVGLSSYDAYTEHRQYRKFERRRSSSSYRGDYNGLKGYENSRVKSAREAASVGFWRDAGWNAVYSVFWPLHATGEGVSEVIDRWANRSEKLTE